MGESMLKVISFYLCTISTLNFALVASPTLSLSRQMKARIPDLSQVPDNSLWITERLDILGDKPISTIIFPGAHDADSSQITTLSPVCKGAISPWAVLSDLLGIAEAYSNSQSSAGTLPNLAKAGIRFFDLRVCAYDNNYYGAHGLISAPLFDDKLLGGLSRFAKENPQELIFVRFQSQGTAIEQVDSAQKFGDLFAKLFKGSLISDTDFTSNSTLNQVLTQGNVIAIWDLASPDTDYFWPSNDMPYSWPNSTDIETVLSRELAAINARPANSLYVSYMDMTPTLAYILDNLFSSLLDMEKNMNKATIGWLKKLPLETLAKFNIIAFDAVLFDPQLIDEIISANDKLWAPRNLRGFGG